VRVFNPRVCNKFKIGMDTNRLEFTEENLDQCFWFMERKGIGGLIIASSIQPMKENELLIIPREHIDLLLPSVYKDPKVTGEGIESINTLWRTLWESVVDTHCGRCL